MIKTPVTICNSYLKTHLIVISLSNFAKFVLIDKSNKHWVNIITIFLSTQDVFTLGTEHCCRL